VKNVFFFELFIPRVLAVQRAYIAAGHACEIAEKFLVFLLLLNHNILESLFISIF
jgi:hypothetical protein